MLKAIETKPFKFNLQLFANPFDNPEFAAKAQEFVQSQQAPTQEQPSGEQQVPQGDNAPQNNPQNTENSGQPSQDGGNQEQGQQPNQPQAGEQPQEQAPNNAEQGLILGKFRSPEELVNAYQQLEAFNTKTRQELAQVNQTAEQLASALEQTKSQQQPVQTQEPDPQAENESFMNMFYENPKAALAQIIQQAVMPQIQPIQQQFQQQQHQQAFNQANAQLMEQYPDAQQFQPAIMQILQQNPELNGHPNGPQAALNIAYQMAKGQQYQSPQAMFSNKDTVMQNLSPELMNEIKQQAVNEYLQGLNKNNATPVTISNQVGGNMPMTPENRPQNMAEASEMALRMFQK